MNSPKFKLIKDWTMESEFAGLKTNKIIYKKGHEFSANEDGLYLILCNNEEISLKKEEMESLNDKENLFEVIKNEFEIIVEEVSDDDDNLIGNWRIQLDVKTTRKKLKEIEKIFRETIESVL
jgi:hypothetical protein